MPFFGVALLMYEYYFRDFCHSPSKGTLVGEQTVSAVGHRSFILSGDVSGEAGLSGVRRNGLLSCTGQIRGAQLGGIPPKNLRLQPAAVNCPEVPTYARVAFYALARIFAFLSNRWVWHRERCQGQATALGGGR